MLVRRRILTVCTAVIVAAMTVLCPLLATPAAAAQSATVGGNALKVSPVRLDLVMDPGTTKQIDVSVKNLTNVTATLHPVANDFTASGDESGKPNIMLDEDEFAPTHSLKRFVRPLTDFTLKPSEERNIRVTITVPKEAAGGGYYGAIRFSPADPSGDRNVNLAASVGTLVLLRVNGDIRESLSVASFDARKGAKGKASTFFTTNKDLTGVVRFENDGNIQVEPFGAVTLKRFGTVVENFQINAEDDVRASVLPDSIRRFDIKLDKVSSFGKFTLEGNFGYGSSGQLLSEKATFYVVPVPMIIIALGALVGLVLLLKYVPKMIRAYNRRIIRKAGRR
jgi:hypothetical protein